MKNYIAALRFPLAVCVVMIHAYTTEWQTATATAGGGHTAFGLVATLLSHVLPSFAVPLFFAISGYLFFLNARDFSLHTYGKKLSRRVRTLLVPYVVWTAVALLLYALRDMHGLPSLHRVTAALSASWAHHGGFDSLWGCTPMGKGFRHILGFWVHATTGPALQPLWFVRDLMVVALLTPVVYRLLRHLGFWGLLVPALLHYGHLWPNLGGISAEGLWFFSLGAWMSIRQIDPVAATRRLLQPAVLLSVPAAVCLLAFGNGPFHGAVQALYHYAAMTLAVQAAAGWCRTRKPSQWLSESAFFVYAAHIIVLSPVAHYARALTLHAPGHWQLAGYLAAPAAALAVCLLAYRFLSNTSHFWPLGVKERE